MRKKIEGFNYFIDEQGNLFNSKGHQMKWYTNKDGYKCATVIREDTGERATLRRCRAIALCFIPNPENKPQVNHINSIRDDDRIENLEWVTASENKRHGVENNPEIHKGQAEIGYEEAHKICALIQDGLRSIDISELTGVSKDTIDHISKGKTWREVSREYNFPPKGSRVSKVTAKWVHDMLSKGYTYQQILDRTTNKRLTLKIISLIDSKRIYKEIF